MESDMGMGGDGYKCLWDGFKVYGDGTEIPSPYRPLPCIFCVLL